MCIRDSGYGDVREFVGHGIQPTMHEDPMVPHYGEHGQGLRLKNGMTITVEPMINTGTWEADTSDPSEMCIRDRCVTFLRVTEP